MNHAYSILNIKAMDGADGKRTFTGIATTPTADRTGDIVEPKGMEFVLPLPLLWAHDSHNAIGWVRTAKVTAKGIEIEGEFANIPEPLSLKERLDEYWALVKHKVFQGLSIGFKPLESARIGDSYSYRYLRSLWLELSIVSIPMNGDCSITAIKSADQALRRAASGARSPIRLERSAPAASGPSQPGDSGSPRRKGVIYLNPTKGNQS